MNVHNMRLTAKHFLLKFHTFQSLSQTIIIHLTHANVWESIGKPCNCMQFIKSCIFYYKSCENPYQYYKSRENPYQVMQVTRAASQHEILWENHYHHSTKLYWKKITRLLSLALLLVLCTRNNTHGIDSRVTLPSMHTATNSWYFPL